MTAKVSINDLWLDFQRFQTNNFNFPQVSISTAVFLVIVALTNAEPKSSSSDPVRRSTYSSYSDSRDSYSRDNDGYRSPRYESSGPSDETSEEYQQPAPAAPKSKKTVILAIPVKLALQNQQSNQDRQYGTCSRFLGSIWNKIEIRERNCILGLEILHFHEINDYVRYSKETKSSATRQTRCDHGCNIVNSLKTT